MSGEKQYTQAFNNGYILAQHEPELLKKVSQNLSPVNNYLEGFFTGKDQFELENSQYLLSELQLLRNQAKENERDLKR